MLTNANVKILVVDDEKNILSAIKRMSFDLDIDIDFASSGVEAIKAFNEHPYDIIVSDIKMPDMDGIKLLSYIKDEYPTTTRIILSGHVDGNLVFDIIKKSIAHTYMYKPWDNEKLISLLKKVSYARMIALNEGIMDIVGSIDVLSIHPQTLEKIKLYYPFEEDDENLLNIINNDAALAMRFIHISNSLNAESKPQSIYKAVNYLTKEQINKILQDYLLDDKLIMNIPENSKLEFFLDYMISNRKIIEKLHFYIYESPISQELNLIGLLFDIGKIMKFEYKNILNNIDINHEKLGGAILNLWRMPTDLIECALYHNDPFNPEIKNKEIVYLISLSNYINSIVYNSRIENYDWESIIKGLGKSENDFESFLKELVL